MVTVSGRVGAIKGRPSYLFDFIALPYLTIRAILNLLLNLQV